MSTKYPKIWNYGHRYTAGLFPGEVYVQEKVDGSQFNFGLIDGQLYCASKNQVIDVENPEKLFSVAVGWCKQNQDKFTPGWLYRAEYLRIPKHNTLSYSRVPRNNLILFDISRDPHGNWAGRDVLTEQATILGIELIPELFRGYCAASSDLMGLLETESCLGGCRIEGFVVKQETKLDELGNRLSAKVVAEGFKEANSAEWKKNKPAQADFIIQLGIAYGTPQRFLKGYQALRDAGRITHEDKDIGALFKQIANDLEEECVDEIKEKLWQRYRRDILKRSCQGVPNWYRGFLVERMEKNAEGNNDLPAT